MRWVGLLLMVVGVLWIVICYIGTAMMSRSVNWTTEALLPSLLGVAVGGVGLWLMLRRSK